MKIIVNFNKNWFFSERVKHQRAINQLMIKCNEYYNNDIISQESFLNCVEFDLNGSYEPNTVGRTIERLVQDNIGEQGAGIYSIKIDGVLMKCEEPATTFEEKQEEILPKPERPRESEIEHPTIEMSTMTEAQGSRNLDSDTTEDRKTDTLVGAEEFKELCFDIERMAPRMIERNTKDIFFSRVCLFYINPGCGYHTAMEILSNTIYKSNLVDKMPEIRELTLPSPKEEQNTAIIDSMLTDLSRYLKNTSGKVYSIDVTAWVDQTGTLTFKRVLGLMLKYNKANLIIFRFPYLNQTKMDEIDRDVYDMLSIKRVAFKPFTDAQMREIAVRRLKRYNYTLEENCWPFFDKAISYEMADGYFYGATTVHKVVHDMVMSAQKFSLDNGMDSDVITAEMLESNPITQEEEPEIGLEALDEMIGLENVADQVRSVISQIAYSRANGISTPSMHMCFVGNPGTGKTTVARIIGAVMREKGFLRIGKFYEHHGRDFVAKYVGHTAAKTARLCEQAYGSVLFIDEAYSLVDMNHGRDFGQEAVDTLVAQMENHRDDMIVILAGYPAETQELLDANPGMRDRIKYIINFPNYTREQLYEIFMQMSRSRFQVSEAYESHAREFFLNLSDEFIHRRSFGNARFVRNLYENVWGHAVRNHMDVPISELRLEAEDFDDSAKQVGEVKNKKTLPIGFSLT